MDNSKLKKIVIDIKTKFDSALKGKKFLVHGKKAKIKIYFEDNTREDDGDLGYSLKIMLERFNIIFYKEELYLGDLCFFYSKEKLLIGHTSSNQPYGKDEINEFLSGIEKEYGVKISKSYFSAEEYQETGGGIM